MSPETSALAAILGPVEVRDVTDDPDLLAAARWQVAIGYRRLLDAARNVDLSDVFTTLCADGYEHPGRSRTFAVLVTDAATGKPEVAGVVRLVLGRGGDPAALAPIDAMNFVQPISGWPHRRDGVGDEQIAEIGRFTILPKFRTPAMRAAGVDVAITRWLLKAVFRTCTELGMTRLYAVMPASVSELVARTGTRMTEEPMALRHDDEHAARVFSDFSVYWQRMRPGLYMGRAPQTLTW